MRSESSALSLHHIKTTVFTVVFGTPVHQRACRAFGNRAVSTAVRFSVGCKKTTELFSRFGTPVNQRACRAYGKRAVLTAVRFSVGCKKTTVFTVVLVLPCISEHAERSGIGLCQQPFDSPLGVKKRLIFFSRFGTPVHQRACRAYGNRDDGTPSFDFKSG